MINTLSDDELLKLRDSINALSDEQLLELVTPEEVAEVMDCEPEEVIAEEPPKPPEPALVVSLLEGLQTIQDKLFEKLEKPVEKTAPAVPDKEMKAILKSIQTMQTKMMAEATKPVTIEMPPMQTDYTVVALMKNIQALQEQLMTKRKWEFDIQRNTSGGITNITATEL